MRTNIWPENFKITDNVADLGIYLRLILTGPYRKYGMRMWNGLTGKCYGPIVGFC
jgi:hypothetical protein